MKKKKRKSIGNIKTAVFILFCVFVLSVLFFLFEDRNDHIFWQPIIDIKKPSDNEVQYIISRLSSGTDDINEISRRTSLFVSRIIEDKGWINTSCIHNRSIKCILREYPCIRVGNKENFLYPIRSRCGSCGEHANMFSYLMSLMNYSAPVVTLYRSGGDHTINEIRIGNETINIDPSDGIFNESRESEMYPNADIFYATKRYINGTIEEYSEEYVRGALGNVSLRFTLFGRPLKNWGVGLYAGKGFNKVTDENGSIFVGAGGNRTFNVTCRGPLGYKIFKDDEINVTSNSHLQKEIKVRISYKGALLILSMLLLLLLCILVRVRTYIPKRKRGRNKKIKQ